MGRQSLATAEVGATEGARLPESKVEEMRQVPPGKSERKHLLPLMMYTDGHRPGSPVPDPYP